MNLSQFNYKYIVLGRESRGIGQRDLANILGFSQGKMSKIESGLLSISESEISKICDVLNYPYEFFLRQDRLRGFGLGEFFHRKRQRVSQQLLHKIYAKIEIRRLEIKDLLNSVDIGQPNFFSVDIDKYNGDIEKIAQLVRVSWGITRGPIDNVIDVIEEAGGIVIPFDFEGAQIDAISTWVPEQPPLFFVNMDRPMDRIRFTLCHEIGHIIMHAIPSTENTDIEHEADRFASEFLLPSDEISSSLKDLKLEKLSALKMHWKVSMQAIIMKATQLGKISDRQSRYLWMQLSKAGYRTHEPELLSPPIEKPKLLQGIIKIYRDELKYNLSELSKVVHLTQTECASIYQNVSHLRLIN